MEPSVIWEYIYMKAIVENSHLHICVGAYCSPGMSSWSIILWQNKFFSVSTTVQFRTFFLNFVLLTFRNSITNIIHHLLKSARHILPLLKCPSHILRNLKGASHIIPLLVYKWYETCKFPHSRDNAIVTTIADKWSWISDRRERHQRHERHLQSRWLLTETIIHFYKAVVHQTWHSSARQLYMLLLNISYIWHKYLLSKPLIISRWGLFGLMKHYRESPEMVEES